jgi:hypothetical protein
MDDKKNKNVTTWTSVVKGLCSPLEVLRCSEAYRLKKSQKWWYMFTVASKIKNI